MGTRLIVDSFAQNENQAINFVLKQARIGAAHHPITLRKQGTTAKA